MKTEIIAVGTELLLGQIVNTNAQFISQELAALGVDVYFQTVVGDNFERIKEALHIARQRAELIICTGGLGPTQDDLTKEVVAEYVQQPLILDTESMERITSFFNKRGITMVKSNEKQALIIKDSQQLQNDNGLAVGVALTHEGKHFVLLPGPPTELKPMFIHYTIPWIRSMMEDELPLYSKMIKFAGIGESTLAHTINDLIMKQQDPTIAPYAKEGEVSIRLSTKAKSYDEAMSKMHTTEVEIHKRLGSNIYAEEDVELQQTIVETMLQNKQTLSIAESCTGGLLGDIITSVSGSSGVFKGGIICYSNEWKHSLLKVPADMLEGPQAAGAVSAEVAVLLAEQMRYQANTTFAVSITGVAGPNESEGKPVGLVYIAISQLGKETSVNEIHLSGNREGIKLRAAKQALYYLWKQLR